MHHTHNNTIAKAKRLVASALLVALWMQHATPAFAITFDSAASDYFDTVEDFGLSGGSDNISMRFGTTLGEFLRFNRSADKFILSNDLDVRGTLSGSALTIMGGTSYLLGNVGIGSSTTPQAKLEVVGTISGSALKITGTAAISGALVLEGSATLSGGTLRGFGLLTDCDNSVTSKLLWDSTTGRFSCGTDQTGGSTGGLSLTDADARYVNTHGDTMTGKLALSNTMLDVTGSGQFTAYDPADVVLRVKADMSQSGNLQEWVDGNDSMYVNVAANGNLNVLGNAMLGQNGSYNLTVNANAAFNGDVMIGNDGFDNLSVYSNTAFHNVVTMNDSVTLGDSATDNITFYGGVLGEFNPYANLGANIGNWSNYWNYGYFGTLNAAYDMYASGNVGAGNYVSGNYVNATYDVYAGGNVGASGYVSGNYVNATYDVYAGSNASIGGVLTLGALDGNIYNSAIPYGDLTFDLGSVANKWRTAYLGSANVYGILSGVTLYATKSFSGAGLTDCDDGTNSKLLWDATTGRFSCGTDQSGGSSGGGMAYATASGIFLKRSGGTMTGTLSLNLRAGYGTGALLNVARVGSGKYLRASGSSLFSTDQMALGQLDAGAFFGRTKLTENHWKLSDIGSLLTARASSLNWNAVAMSSDGTYQTATVASGQIYTSNDQGLTWTARDSSRAWNSVAVNADGKFQTATVSSGQIYTSSNYGATWTARDSNRAWVGVAMSADGLYQTAVVSSGQIYTSNNYGATWTARDSSRSWTDVAMSSDGRIQTAVGPTTMSFVSHDYGATWTARANGGGNKIAMSADGRTHMAVESGAGGGHHLISRDYGQTWTDTEEFCDTDVAMSADGKTIACSGDTLYAISTDGGLNWTTYTPSGTTPYLAMSSDGKTLAMAVTGQFIYTSPSTSYTYGRTAIGTSLSKGAALHVAGTISGTTMYATKSFSGAGLSDCDNATNSKLLWDAATGRFSCGTDQDSGGTGGGISLATGDARYVNTHGDTMTGKLLLNRTSLDVRGSGTFVGHDSSDVVLVVKGTGASMADLQQWKNYDDSLLVNIGYNGTFWTQDTVNAGYLVMRSNTSCDSLDTDSNGTIVCGYDNTGIQSYDVPSYETDPYYYSNPNGYINSSSDNIGYDTYFNITDGSTSEFIGTWDTINFADGTGIDVVVSATDTVTINSNNIYANDMNQNVGTDDTPSFSTVTANDITANNFLIGTYANIGAGRIAVSDFTSDVVLNEDGGDFDIRMEGDNDQNLFFADASTDRIGIGTNSPKAKFSVAGVLSGVTLYATRSFSGAGLSDCDNSTTSKLLWDAATGRFSCGTDQDSGGTGGGISLATGDARYVNTHGDTMTGKLALSNTMLDVTGSGQFTAFDSADVVLRVKGHMSQSGNLQEWVDANNSMYMNVAANGTFSALHNVQIGQNSSYNLTVNANSVFQNTVYANNNVFLGDTTGDNISFYGLVNTDVNPFMNNSYNIGNNSNQWNKGYFVDLSVNNNASISGSAFLGTDNSDYIYFGGHVNSSFNASSNNSYNIGNSSNRWANGWFVNANLAADLSVLGNSTLSGNVSVAGAGLTKARLAVNGVMSGVTVYATRSFSGAGLTDCDTAGTSKLMWDATTARFSCGTDQTGGGSSGGGLALSDADARYVNTAGDSMTGALTIDLGTQGTSGNGTGLVVREKAVFQSGATLSGQLLIKTNGDPATPPADSLYVYAKTIADRSLLKAKGPSGVDYAYQPSLFQNQVAMWFPATGTTAGHIFGWTFTSAGTVSHPTIASTNMLTQMRRTRWASTTTANGVGGIFTATTVTWRGNAAGMGGFFFYARFGQAVNTNGARAFVGLSAASTHIVAAEPSAAVNTVGMGYDAADASTGNWRIMHNDGSGTATEIDLGTDAARNTTTVFDLFLFAPPNGSTIGVRVNNVSTGVNIYEGTLTTDLPTSTTFLRVHAGGGPAASVTAQNFELNRLYLESDT